jgi:pyrroline-5-carboxylate reductase
MPDAPLSSYSLTFVGGGNMARALIKGLIARGTPAGSIQVIEPAPSQRESLTAHFGVSCSDTATAPALAVDVIVLAVKPQHMREAVAAIAPWIHDQLVLSVAAGVRALDISRWLGGHSRVVRAMPNTPAQVGWGATGIAGIGAGDQTDLALAEAVLSAVGITVRVKDENLLDAVTALSGSGPAYVFRFLEALIEGGTALGLAPDTARTLALQTVLGAAQLARESQDPPARLREQVTSKGGTTAAALEVIDQGRMVPILREAMLAAARRSRELGDGFGDSALL